MINVGDFAVNSTVRFMWNTNAASGASITRATNGTIRIYKNNSTTERTSSNGITDTEDFDSQTGVHHCNIDLSDNTDAGFYAAGNDYMVVINGATIDGQTVNACIAMFSIENRFVGSAPSAASIADAVWDEASADHVSAGSTGERVERLDIIASGGSGGLTNTRAINLDNLDAAVSTRFPTASAPTNFSSLSIDASGRVKSRVAVIKNTALNNFEFVMTNNSTHTPLSGLTDGSFTTKVESIDGAATTALSGTITEIGSTGIYKINLTAGELNGDVITLVFGASGADTRIMTIVTSA
jgi:hypothetical protein